MVHTFSDKNNRYSVDMMISYINIFKPDSIFINVNEYEDYLDNDCWGYFNKKKRIKITPKIVLENPKKYKKHINRINNAKLKYPIIIYKDKHKSYIIDGVHRLINAIKNNKKKIKAIIFNRKILNKFIISKKKNNIILDVNFYIELFYKRFLKK